MALIELTPIFFDGVNTVFTGPDDIGDLPACEKNGTIITMWECDDEQAKQEFAKTGRICLAVYYHSIPPVSIYLNTGGDDAAI